MAKKTTTTCVVGAIVKMWVEIEVTAATLEVALEKARKLAVTDFVNAVGAVNDSSFTVVQVYDADKCSLE